jgi:hypothetical protein
MTTKSLGPGYRIDKSGKLTKRPPRMAPVLARAQKAKADRQEKQWRGKSK